MRPCSSDPYSNDKDCISPASPFCRFLNVCGQQPEVTKPETESIRMKCIPICSKSVCVLTPACLDTLRLTNAKKIESQNRK